MPLDAAQYVALVTLEVGDVDGLIASQVDTLWTLYDTQTDDYIHYLFVKRKAIELLMGSVREQVTRQIDGPLLVTLTDKFKNLQTMWNDVNEEIGTATALVLTTTAQASTAVVGQILAPCWPDGIEPVCPPWRRW